MEFVNLSCFAEGDAARSMDRVIGLSIVFDHANARWFDGNNEVRECMVV